MAGSAGTLKAEAAASGVQCLAGHWLFVRGGGAATDEDVVRAVDRMAAPASAFGGTEAVELGGLGPALYRPDCAAHSDGRRHLYVRAETRRLGHARHQGRRHVARKTQ